MRREHLYGLHGVYLDAYDAIVEPDNIWPVRHYVLRRWAPIWGGAAFWLYVALHQSCYRNPNIERGNSKDWCVMSRKALARSASLGPATVDRLLHRALYKTTGLCHWIWLQKRRSWSEKAGTVVQQANRYDIILTPPLAPVDQHGLVQFLLENGVEPGTSVDIAVPALEDLANRDSLNDLLTLLEDCAGRFCPPHGWLAEKFLSTPFDVVRALRLQSLAGQERARGIRELCSRVHRALIAQPQPLLQTQYFRQHWVPRLGHNLALLIVTLRSRCFWNQQILRDSVTLYPVEMARAIGLKSGKQINRLLAKPEAQMFLTILDSGRGKPITVKVLLREPITPEDQPRYQQLLLGRLARGENGHFEHQTQEAIGHFEHLTQQEIGHFERQTSPRSDILSGVNGHFEHHLNTISTTTSTEEQQQTPVRKTVVVAPQDFPREHLQDGSEALKRALVEVGIKGKKKQAILDLDDPPHDWDVYGWFYWAHSQDWTQNPVGAAIEQLLDPDVRHRPPEPFQQFGIDQVGDVVVAARALVEAYRIEHCSIILPRLDYQGIWHEYFHCLPHELPLRNWADQLWDTEWKVLEKIRRDGFDRPAGPDDCRLCERAWQEFLSHQTPMRRENWTRTAVCPLGYRENVLVVFVSDSIVRVFIEGVDRNRLDFEAVIGKTIQFTAVDLRVGREPG
jgi:hypothetical protein